MIMSRHGAGRWYAQSQSNWYSIFLVAPYDVKYMRIILVAFMIWLIRLFL